MYHLLDLSKPTITMSLSSLEVQATTDIAKLKAEYLLLSTKSYSFKQAAIAVGAALVLGLIIGLVL